MAAQEQRFREQAKRQHADRYVALENFVQGAMSFETLSGKNTTECYWRRGFSLFSSGLNEDGLSSTAVTPNHGKPCQNDAVATSAATGRNAATTRRNGGPGATVPRTSRATTC